MIDEAINTVSRVRILRENLYRKTHVIYRTECKFSLFDEEEFAGEPVVTRKARAIVRILKGNKPYIQERELIVGGRTHYYSLNPFNPFTMDNNGYLRGNAGHTSPYYPLLLKEGIEGIQARARKKFGPSDNRMIKEDSKIAFWRAVIICCEAVIDFACRYSALASNMAEEEKDLTRRQELEEMASIMSKVPAGPARNFREALQSVFFMHVCLQATLDYCTLGRIDQYLYPYYKADIENGQLNRQKAKELLGCFWVKCNEEFDLRQDNQQHLTIGGLTPQGEDATNDLTFLFLEIATELMLSTPTIAVRVSEKSPDTLWQMVCRYITAGGVPGIYNDEAIIKNFTDSGIPVQEARDYANDSCVYPAVYGRSNNNANPIGFSFLTPLEMVLNGRPYGSKASEGIASWLLKEKKEGIRNYSTMEALLEAIKESIFDITKSEGAALARQVIDRADNPDPLLSCLVQDCLESGKDIHSGGAVYNNIGWNVCGLQNAADSLAAIEEIVYRQKRFSLTEMTEIFKNDFKGSESLRQELLHHMPKFGNDDDKADRFAILLWNWAVEAVEKCLPHYHNGRFRPGYHGYGYVNIGRGCGASADGRHDRDPIGDNLGASPGRDRNGPTALLLSVSKLNLSKATNGGATDLMLHPTCMSNKVEVDKVIKLIQTFFRLGSLQIQPSVVKRETLLDAQKNPERYENLMVKVWGFSAQFVSLDEKFQEHIIARTHHRLQDLS